MLKHILFFSMIIIFLFSNNGFCENLSLKEKLVKKIKEKMDLRKQKKLEKIKLPVTLNYHKIKSDNLERNFHYYIPQKKKENRALVFVIHGGGGASRSMAKLVGEDIFKLSEKFNFILVFPNAYKNHWNDGRDNQNHESHRLNINDVKFFDSMITWFTVKYKIDSNKIFATGISNGGFMSYRLALQRPEIFAAIAPVSTSMTVFLKKLPLPSTPVPLCILRGTADPVIPWNGGEIKIGFNIMGKYRTTKKSFGFCISSDSVINHWKKINNTKLISSSKLNKIHPEDNNEITLEKYSGSSPRSDIHRYIIKNGGHSWPGGFPSTNKFIIGKTTTNINATEIIMKFFSTHGK